MKDLSITNLRLSSLQCLTAVGVLSIKLSVTHAEDFSYVINNSAITITRYSGPGGAVTIPDAINGLQVTRIGDNAFWQCAELTAVTIPTSVTAIGSCAFLDCENLTDITIPDSVTILEDKGFTGMFTDCHSLRNVKLGSGITSIGHEAFYGCTSLTEITVPDNVTVIGDLAFGYCTNLAYVDLGRGVKRLEGNLFLNCARLASITIPANVTIIDGGIFPECTNLTGVYFNGDAPQLEGYFGSDTAWTVYYLPGTSGWTTMYGGRPTAPWPRSYPTILTSGASLGVRTNGFGFAISWASDKTVVIEAADNLSDSTWSSVSTNTLARGTSYFSDPLGAKNANRFYRVRAQ